MWWSRGIGGKSALDYLIKVRGMDFVQAVQTIMGNGSVNFPTCENIKSYEEQPLLLPEKAPLPMWYLIIFSGVGLIMKSSATA